MRDVQIIWDLPDEPEGNYRHILDGHDVTIDEVEEVLLNPDSEDAISRSSGKPGAVWMDFDRPVHHRGLRVGARRSANSVSHYGLPGTSALREKFICPANECIAIFNGRQKIERAIKRPEKSFSASDRRWNSCSRAVNTSARFLTTSTCR